jgi:hypothetical protein
MNKSNSFKLKLITLIIAAFLFLLGISPIVYLMILAANSEGDTTGIGFAVIRFLGFTFVCVLLSLLLLIGLAAIFVYERIVEFRKRKNNKFT